MSKAKTVTTPASRTAPSTITVARRALGAYMLVFLLSQLFSFEKFPELLQSVGFTPVLATIVAILMVCSGLLAMPFLIGVDVRKPVITLSRISCFVALGLLSVVEVMAYMSGSSVLFGATFDVPGGSWSLLLVVSLWILLVWTSSILIRFSEKPKR